jgi:hypothetical protein
LMSVGLMMICVVDWPYTGLLANGIDSAKIRSNMQPRDAEIVPAHSSIK